MDLNLFFNGNKLNHFSFSAQLIIFMEGTSTNTRSCNNKS